MRVAILAEQNFGLVDGSTIWTLNLCRMLCRIPKMEVALLLREDPVSRVLVDELPEAVEVISPSEIGPDLILSAEILAKAVLAAEAKQGRFDRIIVRGEGFLLASLEESEIALRVVAYSPSAVVRLAEAAPDWIALARDARRPVLTQSTTAKAIFETFHDFPASLVYVLPPVACLPEGLAPARDGAAGLVYSGKIDPDYGLGWLCDLVEMPADARGFDIRILAGKVMAAADPQALARFEQGVAAQGRGVRLTAGFSHGAALREMAGARFGYCLRSPAYDEVVEISTKVLEFCALGVAPILNDNLLNRRLMGEDYPFLFDVTRAGLAERLVRRLTGATDAQMETARRCMAKVAAAASPEAGVAVLQEALGAAPDRPERQAPLALRIATHDDKFLGKFLDRLSIDPLVDLHREQWAGIGKSGDLAAPAGQGEVIFCEWCGENAVWHSHNKPPGARLVVRLHRFEAFTDYPARVNWPEVDRLVVVSDHFKELMSQRHGIGPDRITVLPQYVDARSLARAKRPEARYVVGLVGIFPFAHKRLDRAVDFLQALRAQEPRFSMVVRSTMPWQARWAWENRPKDRSRFEALFQRIHADPELAAAIRFDPPGADMEEWFRDVGFVLSTSDTEGCHTSVMEGIASGAMPIVRDWPGARQLFGDLVWPEAEDAIPAVIAHAGESGWEGRCRALSARAAGWDIGPFTERMLEAIA